VILAALALAALAAPPCGTAARLHDAPRPAWRAWPTPPPGPKPARDAWGSYPNELPTENFVLKWGLDGDVSQAQAAAVGALLETAWVDLIAGLGMPAPAGSEHYLMNVYIAGTGPQLPPSYDNAAYFYYDDDGWPMLVINLRTLDDPELTAITTSHELFHALQDATGSYPYDGPGAWYSEASAVWASGHTHPDLSETVGKFLFAVAYRPELPLNTYAYPTTGAIEEYYAYGSFIFLQFLDERGDAGLIVDAWLDPRGEERPLATFADLLGGDLGPSFFDFEAANAHWSYAHRDEYLSAIDIWAPLSAEPHRPSGPLVLGAAAVAPEFAPHTLGANYWSLPPAIEPLRIEVRSEAEPTTWDARIAFADGSSVALVASERDPTLRWADLPALDAGTAAPLLVVSAVNGLDGEDPWTLTYTARATAPPTATCGCTASSPPSWAWILAAWVAARRRVANRR